MLLSQSVDRSADPFESFTERLATMSCHQNPTPRSMIEELLAEFGWNL
jgi:hypothetical protein